MGERKQQVPRQKPLTSVDVARKAGVSRTAVSYVLNGIQNTHVSEETRSKVLQAAQELGYHMHSSAQSLRKGRSNEIGLITETPMSSNDAETYLSILQGVLSQEYMPVLYYI